MSLTPRQQEIARMIAEQGLSSGRIARQLGISRRTVERHISYAAARIPGTGTPRLKVAIWWVLQHVDGSLVSTYR